MVESRIDSCAGVQLANGRAVGIDVRAASTRKSREFREKMLDLERRSRSECFGCCSTPQTKAAIENAATIGERTQQLRPRTLGVFGRLPRRSDQRTAVRA